MQEQSPNQILQTVLILEDDFFSVTLLEMSLQEAGYKTIHFADTDAALKGIEVETPDILLSDWALAGEASAADVARALRLKNPDARIIFITGYHREDINEKLQDLEPFDFLIKPIDFAHLAERISSQTVGKSA